MSIIIHNSRFDTINLLQDIFRSAADQLGIEKKLQNPGRPFVIK